MDLVVSWCRDGIAIANCEGRGLMNRLEFEATGSFIWNKMGAGLLLACAAMNFSAGEAFGIPGEACCLPNDTCQVRDPGYCFVVLGGSPQGPGTTCIFPEACCLPDDWTCTEMALICCIDRGGTSKGPSTTCDPVEDHQACKHSEFACDMMDVDCCSLIGQAVIPPGEVCDSLGCCGVSAGMPFCSDDVDEDVCIMAGGFGSLPEGQACDTGSVSCCMPDDTCADLTPLCCAALGTPNAGSCTSLEACCGADGSCEDGVAAGCCTARGDSPLGPGSVCGIPQACCQADGTCADGIDPGCCENQGGTAQGDGSTCGPLEGCCLPDDFTCQDLTAACCADQSGTSKGPATACAPVEEQHGCRHYGTDCDAIDPVCCDLIGQGPIPPGEVCDSLGCCVNVAVGSCLDDVDEDVCIMVAGFGSLPEGQACDTGSVSCCMPDNTCAALTPNCCAALGFPPAGSCGSAEACCGADGSCEDGVLAGCCTARGDSPLGPGSVCGATEACCFQNGRCLNSDPQCCGAHGGFAMGPGTSCGGPNNCMGGEE